MALNRKPNVDAMNSNPQPAVNQVIGASTSCKGVNRLRHGSLTTPRLQRNDQALPCLWGEARWSDQELRQVLIQRVTEGQSLWTALDILREISPPMPDRQTVNRWLSMYPDFKSDYLSAQRLRGELQVEAATELAIDALGDPTLDPRNVKNALEQLRWHASKLNRETFGEHRTLEVQQPMAAIADQDLDRRIKALMGDPQVRGVLNAQGFEVLDVEVVEETSSSDSLANQKG